MQHRINCKVMWAPLVSATDFDMRKIYMVDSEIEPWVQTENNSILKWLTSVTRKIMLWLMVKKKHDDLRLERSWKCEQQNRGTFSDYWYHDILWCKLLVGTAESIQPALSATRLTSPSIPNIETASPTVPATPSSQDKAEDGASETAEANG